MAPAETGVREAGEIEELWHVGGADRSRNTSLAEPFKQGDQEFRRRDTNLGVFYRSAASFLRVEFVPPTGKPSTPTATTE